MTGKELLALSITVSLTILTGIILSSSSVIADIDVIDVMTLGVPQSCTMSGTGMNSHTDEVENGTYSPDIGTTTLHVFCNDNGGFAVYAVGYTDNEFGKNVLTDSTLGSTYDIITGTNTSGSTSNWAMKLAITQDSGDITSTNAFTLDNSFGSYHNVPAEYTKVAHKNTATDMTNATGGVKLTTTYAVLISPNQPAGTYTGQVKYTLVHPASETPLQPQTTEADCIRYYPNGSNVGGTMGCQPISSSDTSATLLASNFSREGYGFAGWSTTYDYSDSTGFLGPQEYISFTAGQYTGNNPGLSLYAHWVKSTGNLQGWNGCSSLAPEAVTALTDLRDNETYAIAKLADGNCWMIENMRLENTAEHNTDGTLAQGYNTSFAGLADPEAASLFTDTATANTLYSTDGSTNKTISGSSQGYRFPRYSNINTPTTASDRPQNPTSNSATNSTSNASMYSYGNYYTWAAAIADTTAYTTNNQSATSTSICPSGWHLPKGGDKSNEVNNEFWALVVTGINNGTKPADYDSSTTPSFYGRTEAGPIASALRAYPNNFVYSGSVSSGSGYNRGSWGSYWSSTASYVYGIYVLNLGSTSIYPGTYNNVKYLGRPIRCLTSGS